MIGVHDRPLDHQPSSTRRRPDSSTHRHRPLPLHMDSVDEPPGRSEGFVGTSKSFLPSFARDIPILSSPAADKSTIGDPMDVTHSPRQSMGPPTMGPHREKAVEQPLSSPQDPLPHAPPAAAHLSNGVVNPPVGAAAAAQQPKVVQTAFIHKLYK